MGQDRDVKEDTAVMEKEQLRIIIYVNYVVRSFSRSVFIACRSNSSSGKCIL
jgi:hypothetical protein